MTIEAIEALLIESGEWAKANGMAIQPRSFTAHRFEGFWESPTGCGCVLDALLLFLQPCGWSRIEMCGTILGVSSDDTWGIVAGFDDSPCRGGTKFYALGARLRARFIGDA